MTIRYVDAEFPAEDCVADGKSIRLWTPEVAREVAHGAMCLAQGAERAAVLLGLDDARDTREHLSGSATTAG